MTFNPTLRALVMRFMGRGVGMLQVKPAKPPEAPKPAPKVAKFTQREYVREYQLKYYRARRQRFYDQGLTCLGKPRKRRQANGWDKDHTAYMRWWRAQRQAKVAPEDVP